MSRQGYAVLGCVGLVAVLCVAVVVGAAIFVFPTMVRSQPGIRTAVTPVVTTRIPPASANQVPPRVTLVPQQEEATVTAAPRLVQESVMPALTELYRQLNPGVVSIQVFVQRGDASGQGAGSGFIIDEQGYIVTNNHVVAGATEVIVVFYNALEVEARVVGTDPDSDLAVIQVAELPEGAHPLPIGDSDSVEAGEWVVAIGNPFGFQSSMSVGIVSAVGRVLPTGTTPFSIPQAIQTDAAINPGNSGGPLLNLQGEVIGVNAQIRTAGAPANAGVGFAVPSNIVRLVAPALIETGTYQWPWLGIEGTSVNLFIAEANDLPNQQGAYISRIVEGGPAEAAGLQGSSGVTTIRGIPVPVGGDVVIEADGEVIRDFSALLYFTAQHRPGDQVTLTVMRDGRPTSLAVTLEARPGNMR